MRIDGRLIVVLAATILLGGIGTGCATIVGGTRQTFTFDTEPRGAMVTINGMSRGVTPVVADLKRREKRHEVHIELEGYEPFDMVLKRKFNAWYLGNVLFGGTIGLIIDPTTGAIFRIGPEEKRKALAERGATLERKFGKLVIRVALKVDPTWQKIASLTPLPGR